MIYVFTGNGKGKTTAAIGTAIRSLGAGKKVLIVQFLKDKTISTETKILENIDGCRIESFGRRGFYLPKEILKENPKLREMGVRPIEKIDEELAIRGLKFIEEKADEFDLVVLDEVCVAIYFCLLKTDDIVKLLKRFPTKDFIITGRNCPEELIEISDLTTEMVEVKHPYQRGIRAKRGLDF